MHKSHCIFFLAIPIFITVLLLSATSCNSRKASPISKSQFFTDSIYSKNLNEYRKHNVYLPKGFDPKIQYSIVYATDGSKSIEKSFYKSVLDSLIQNKIIKPTIYIGSHANSKIADSSGTVGNGAILYLNFRNFEYVSNQYIHAIHNPELASRFENHMQYFKNELITAVEAKFNQSPTKNNRYFYGISNGAGFGISLFNKHPDIIGTYLCFSTFGGGIQSNQWKENVEYPKLYMEYGSEEPFFLKEDADFLKQKFNELDLFSEIHPFDGGHDYKKWNEKFTEIISEILAIE